METAKNTDLPDLLEHLGYSVRRVGSRYHTTREMDSIRIKDRRTWKRYSNGKVGDAITFLQEFCGKDFREAVNYLLEFNGKRSRDSPAPRPKPAQTEEKPAFTLPIPHPDQRRVFAYGSYRVWEQSSPAGYLKDTRVETVEWTGEKDVLLTFENVRDISLTILKVNELGASLEGAVFDVYAGGKFITFVETNSSGEARVTGIQKEAYIEVVEKTAPAGHVLDRTSHGIHIDPYLDRTTSSTGEIVWENLDPGVYSLVETATVDDHIRDLKEYHVEVFPGKESTIVLENQKRPNLYVYKNDADDGSPIEHTIFTVRAADGHSVDEIETDSTGRAELKNLLPGVYEISEKSVPSPG